MYKIDNEKKKNQPHQTIKTNQPKKPQQQPQNPNLKLNKQNYLINI